MNKYDVIIIGAGAAGLMCAITAGQRGRRVLVIEHANKVGKKILMSGGGRCNFTNYHVTPDNFISHNPHFCKSALSRYTQWDFIDLVQQHNIPFHEKAHGQLFCDNKASDIVNMLLAECDKAKVEIRLNTSINGIKRLEHGFALTIAGAAIEASSLVIATGGLSIPTMGASPFGYHVAEQFDLKIWPTRAGLVPMTLHVADKEKYAGLSGVSVAASVTTPRQSFNENILFTHRGLSGPAILQASSYWCPGEALQIYLSPDIDLEEKYIAAKHQQGKQQVKTFLNQFYPKSVVDVFVAPASLQKTIGSLSHEEFSSIKNSFTQWQLKPNGTEGYRTAEVTLGGVDCDAISSKTMEVNTVPGLFFIGEVLDVTGWLGGFNFQWAWSSAWCAGQVV